MGTGGRQKLQEDFESLTHYQLTRREAAAAAPTRTDTVHNVSNWKVIGFVCSFRPLPPQSFIYHSLE